MPKKKKKCQNVFTVDDEEHISKLPDDVICNILSRLITKKAVATSILSKDWKDKWLGISRIDINLLEHEIPGKKLPSILNSLEKKFQRGLNVTKIYFVSGYHGFSNGSSRLIFTSLISTLMKWKAKTLHIDCDDRRVVLPGRLLSGETLRHVLLEESSLKFPTENRFALLKTLRLRHLVISNKIDNTTTLKFTFPVLQALQIYDCEWPHVRSVEIYAPSLRALESIATNLELVDGVEIKIFEAARPVRFESSGRYLDNVLLIGSDIISASIQIGPTTNDAAETLNRKMVRNYLLIECLSTLEILELSFHIAQILAKALVESNHGFIPANFNKLEELSLSYSATFSVPFSTEALFDLLHAAPNLKSLAIETRDDDWDDIDYDAAKSLPSCLLSTLEEIELCISVRKDDSFTSHVRLVKFFMQVVEKAEVPPIFNCILRVEDSDYFKSDKLMEKISSFPRGPPHFTLCATGCLPRRNIKRFRYCKSRWVEDVLHKKRKK